uniref:Uncharacterized protein n=1 Tax=Nelumbo nucifera TaxID=4432 RepID=A0A822Y6D9_NELNU|nr:TPA_asm: hypothetical protein HUJ06_026622 [Nelumbo nucifera]
MTTGFIKMPTGFVTRQLGLLHARFSQSCLEDRPDAVERRPESRFPTGRGTRDGHLKAHHDLQATLARPGKATQLGVREIIVPAASRSLMLPIAPCDLERSRKPSRSSEECQCQLSPHAMKAVAEAPSI